MRIGQIASLWRYPVKSMRGESVPSVALTPLGIAGDRMLALESANAAVGKPLLTGAERNLSLRCRAAFVRPEAANYEIENPEFAASVSVATPEGRQYAADDPSLLESLQAELASDHAMWLRRSALPMTDCRPLALLSLQSVRQLERELGFALGFQRFRANILIDLDSKEGFGEDRLVGRRIQLGACAAILVKERDPRCRIITLDPESGKAEPSVMRHVAHMHEGKVGIYAATVHPGQLAVGDPITLLY